MVVYAQKSTPSRPHDQTYLAMYGYKAPRPQPTHVNVVKSLLALAIIGHTDCDLKLASNARVFQWTTVPSTRDPVREHPLHALVHPLFAPGYELPVRGVQGATKDRAIRPQNYEALGHISPKTHVVVIDDSWVSGGSAQSVASAVRNAGAASVSILAVARILDPSWSTTTDFLRQGRLAQDFGYKVCPWTGSACP